MRLRSIVFYSREERGRWRQGPRCLRCSKLRRIGGLGSLMMTPRRSSGCGAYISELTAHRHRGRSQASWTIVMLVRKPSQSIHTSRETYTFRRRSRMPCVFSWPPLLVGDTVEVVSSSATSSTEFLLRHRCTIYTLVSPANCMCVCVFFPFILDIKFVGRTSRGHTGGRSHRIFHPPSFCGACLNFSREKDSAIPFPYRP